MPIYKSKLKSIADSSGVDLNTYYTNNSPYTGYVVLSKSLSNDYGLFNDKTATKEYLSRGDSNGLIGSSIAVDLSKIYLPSIGKAGSYSSSTHLPCVALGKDIGKDESYFYHYMDIDSATNTNEGGFPFVDGGANNSIITPFSDSGYSKSLYANFTVLGMSKAATPYINAGLFLEDCNHATLSDKTTFNFLGNSFGGAAGIYEFPGYSALSTLFAEVLWYGAKDAWASSSKTGVIPNTLNYDDYQSVDDLIARVATAIYNKLYVGESWSSTYSNTELNNVANIIYGLAITNGSKFYGMRLQSSYNTSSGNQEWSTINGTEKLSSSDSNYEYGSYSTYRIVFRVQDHDTGMGGNYNSYTTYTTYFAVYDQLSYYMVARNEFGNALSYYYDNYGEPIVIDHTTNTNSYGTGRITANTYTLDTTSNVLTNTTKYYVVARPAGPFVNTGSSGIPESEQVKLRARHTSYITRYDAIGLDTGTYYYSTARTAQPLKTPDYMLDSNIVSVLTSSSNIIFNDAKAEKNGCVYVSSITLHFKGNTKSFENKIKISSNDNTRSKTFALNDTSLVCSGENTSRTSYKISLSGGTNSIAYIGYAETTNNAPTKLGMTCDICGSHQMVRYNCGNCKCNSYISHLEDNTAGIDSQWTLLKLSGAFKIQMSGRNVYSTSLDNDTDIILEAVDVEITDSTSLRVGIKYTKPTSYTISCSGTTTYTHIKNLYNNKTQYAMKDNLDYTYYDAECVFFNSLCGAKRMNGNANYYNDTSILFNDWSSTADKNKKVSVYANASNNPVITVGGYGNALESSKYVGAAHNKAVVSSASFTSRNDPLVSTINSYNTIMAPTTVYKTIGNDTTASNLSVSFSTSNTLRYSLPKPDVKLALDYKSVEFNGSSAWTFTRAMPLHAAAAANPHILIYKIEAWVETEDENGNLIVDETASAAITISDINGDNAHKVFSGRTHKINKDTPNEKTIQGVDYAIQNNEVLNNIYLKYNDNETYIYNAVSTSLPIKLLEPVKLPLGDKNEEIDISDFYGGKALNYKILTSTYTNNDETNIQTMYSVIKSNINNDVQICLCSCSGTKDDIDDGVSLTKDGKKVIYFGIGFYNNSDLIMPITASFGIDLTFTDQSTGKEGTYPKRISLNEFFPKDSILYMAGNNHKHSTSSDENSKIRFVKSGESHSLNEDGLKTYNREGTQKTSGAEEGEAVNIGGGIKNSTSHNEGEIHASSIETSGTKVTSLYGIFNIYSGEVNYISTGSSKITNAGIPDVLTSSNGEGSTTGAYSNYVKFMDEISGKCLTRSQHICKFVHCTDNDENGGIPYIL